MAINKQSDSFSKTLARTGTAMLAAAAVVLPACGTGVNDAEVAETDLAEVPQENVTTEALSENLDAYVGETVTVREEVSEVVGEYAFLLDDGELFGGDEALVINASGQPITLVEGDDTQVQVTGEVREFILADIEREFDLDLDPDYFADYEQQAVIVAQSAELSPDPDDITDNPELYYNRRIALNGEVNNVLDANIITIEDNELFGGENLLVINPQADIVTQEDEEVVMTGTLRPFVSAEIEQEYELTWDLDLQEQIEAEYTDRPIFIADEIYPSAY